MNTTHASHRRHRLAAGICASAAGAALILGAATMASATSGDPHKVTLCHATHSATNPYVVITVDVASVLGDHGHGGHTGSVFDPSVSKHDQDWGDIIPAFDYGPGEQYPGLNLADGQAWLDNGCTAPPATTTTTSSTTTSTTSTTISQT